MQQSERPEEHPGVARLTQIAPMVVGLLVAMVLGNAVGTAESSTTKPEPAAVYDAEFQRILDNPHAEMTRKRPLLHFLAVDGNLEVQNCAGYLATTTHVAGRIASNPAIETEHYSDCAILELLPDARGAGSFLGTKQRIGYTIAERLDPSKLKQQGPTWDIKSRRLATGEADSIEIEERSVTLSRGTSTYRVEAVASADLFGGETEELVVRITRDGKATYAALTVDDSGALYPLQPTSMTAAIPVY